MIVRLELNRITPTLTYLTHVVNLPSELRS